MKTSICLFALLSILPLVVNAQAPSGKSASAGAFAWSEEEINGFIKKYGIHNRDRLKYHFPVESFLEQGYYPPGGYVKDFGILRHDQRWHLFHIDGRPGETCWITGNEISFGHASSSDFQHWIRHKMPLAISDQDWENEHIWAPFVHKHRDTFYLFYMGGGTAGSFITYATSATLENWKKASAPIYNAPGRDPFVFEYKGKTILLYTTTAKPTIGACSSTDLKTWEPLPDVLTFAGQAPESASVYPVGNKYVLWFNGWLTTGERKMRSFYVFSDNPLKFDGSQAKEFSFIPHPQATINDDFGPTPHNMVPINLELLAKGEDTWFIAYFRPQADRYRLFFGELDLKSDPAAIREINSEEQLKAVMKRVRLEN